MKIDIVYNCTQGEIIVGKTAFDWMTEGLYGLEETSALYKLTIDEAMPLLTAAYVAKTVGLMNKRGLDGVLLGGGKLERKYAKNGKYVALTSVECATLGGKDDNEIVERLYLRSALKLKEEGVRITSPELTFIEGSVKVGKGSVVSPFVRISGDTVIGENCEIGCFCEIEDSIIADGVKVTASQIKRTKIGDNTRVGPYAYLRDGAEIGKNCRVGDYVEIKASRLSDGVKAAHHAYIGDACVGEGTNVGCGTVFCNYDGKEKRRVVVGKNVFIGSNVNLVAPLSIGDNVYIAAGSTITKDVEDGAFVIARERETVKKRK